MAAIHWLRLGLYHITLTTVLPRTGAFNVTNFTPQSRFWRGLPTHTDMIAATHFHLGSTARQSRFDPVSRASTAQGWLDDHADAIAFFGTVPEL
jgi:hypothetical protein